MILKTCFLFGHSDAPGRCLELLTHALEYHITRLGVRQFIVGQYGNFDRYAATALQRISKRHYGISILLLTPYHPAIRPIAVPDGFDGTYYPPDMEGIPLRFAIVKANRYMVTHCSHIICWVCHPGNTGSLLEYAVKHTNSSQITNLADHENR